jgi:hypothetical protein
MISLNIFHITTNGMKVLLTNWAKAGRNINRQIGELTIIATFWHGAELLLLLFVLLGPRKGQVVCWYSLNLGIEYEPMQESTVAVTRQRSRAKRSKNKKLKHITQKSRKNR